MFKLTLAPPNEYARRSLLALVATVVGRKEQLLIADAARLREAAAARDHDAFGTALQQVLGSFALSDAMAEQRQAVGEPDQDRRRKRSGSKADESEPASASPAASTALPQSLRLLDACLFTFIQAALPQSLGFVHLMPHDSSGCKVCSHTGAHGPRGVVAVEVQATSVQHEASMGAKQLQVALAGATELELSRAQPALWLFAASEVPFGADEAQRSAAAEHCLQCTEQAKARWAHLPSKAAAIITRYDGETWTSEIDVQWQPAGAAK